MKELVDAYFAAFKKGPDFMSPERVIQLLDEVTLLQRKNAALTQELGDLVHQVDHFRFIASHTTQLLETERDRTDGLELVTRM